MSFIAGAIAIGAGAVISAGATIYAGNQASKAQDRATAANKQIADETNRLNYQRWLETQGIGPNGEVVNVGLPRWMTVSTATGGLPKRALVPRGTVGNNTVITGATPIRATPATTTTTPQLSRFSGVLPTASSNRLSLAAQ